MVAASPAGCPSITSEQVLLQLKSIVGPALCPTGDMNPLCGALGKSSNLKQFVNNLKSVSPGEWHRYWDTPAGKERLLGLLIVAYVLKCMSQKGNRDVLQDMGNVKDWFIDNLLPAVAQYKPVKDSNTFSVSDVYSIQATIDAFACTGQRDSWLAAAWALGGFAVGLIVLGIIWAIVAKKQKAAASEGFSF